MTASSETATLQTKRPHRPEARTPPPVMHTVALALILVATLVVGTLPTLAQTTTDRGWPDGGTDWHTYGGSNRQAGITPAIGPQEARSPIRSASLDDASFTAPVITNDGHILVGDDAGNAHKLNHALQDVWTTKVSGKMRASLLIDHERNQVIAAPVSTKLHALDLDTGKERWTTKTGNTAQDGKYVITSAPALHPDGFIVVGSMDGNVTAIDPDDGKVLWRYLVHESPARDGSRLVVSAPAIGTDGTIYIGSQNNHLYALHPDGKLKWRHAVRNEANKAGTGAIDDDEQITGSASLDTDGTIYVGTSLRRNLVGAVYSLTDDGDKATLRWSATHNGKVSTPPTIGPDGVYVGAQDGSMIAFSKQDGSVLWTYQPSEAVRTASESGPANIMSIAEQALLDGASNLYVPYWQVDLTKEFPPQDSEPSPLVVLDAKTGNERWFHVFPKAVRAPAMMPFDADGPKDGTPGGLVLAIDDGQTHLIVDTDVITTAIERAGAKVDDNDTSDGDGPPPSEDPTGAQNDTHDGEQATNDTSDDRDTPGPGTLITSLAVLAPLGLATAHQRRRRTP